jgi:S-DNA-T family DNA segregation ATPase FtsK/SpoIIIE
VKVTEALVAAGVVFLVVWLVVKAVVWAIRQAVTRWRTSLTVLAIGAWWHWWGWPPLVITLGSVTLVLTRWRLIDLASFDAWAGRHLRAWWLRWTVYTSQLPEWLRACGLSTNNDTSPAVVSVTLVGRKKIHRDRTQASAQLPKVLGVRSGASWDEAGFAWWRARNQKTSTRSPGRWPRPAVSSAAKSAN